MIEFYAGKNDALRAVVEKLGAFIKEGAVVLVTLQHHVLALTWIPAAAKIKRHAADKKPRIKAGAFQHPSSQRRRGRFAVCASDNDRLARADQEFSESLRE